MPNNRWQVKIQQCEVINSKTGRNIYTDMKKVLNIYIVWLHLCKGN